MSSSTNSRVDKLVGIFSRSFFRDTILHKVSSDSPSRELPSRHFATTIPHSDMSYQTKKIKYSLHSVCALFCFRRLTRFLFPLVYALFSIPVFHFSAAWFADRELRSRGFLSILCIRYLAHLAERFIWSERRMSSVAAFWGLHCSYLKAEYPSRLTSTCRGIIPNAETEQPMLDVS